MPVSDPSKTPLSTPISTPLATSIPVAADAPTRVWDLPTRVFHAALTVSVGAAIVTAEIGGNWMAWHLLCGETVLSLVVFRWVWGVAGGHWSRFAQFPPSPARLVRHLRGRASATEAAAAGHGALGTWSVWAFLLLLTVQVATGLVADDDIATTGPLNAHVDPHLARRASGWHAGFGADLVMGLIALHVLAIAWYTLRRRAPLLRAMWSGDKPAPPGTRASRDGAGSRLLALGIWGLAAVGVWWMVRVAG